MNRLKQYQGEIYLEFQVIGQSQKATAICAQTHVEVCVSGPVKATREHMTQLAVRKLNRRKQQLGF